MDRIARALQFEARSQSALKAVTVRRGGKLVAEAQGLLHDAADAFGDYKKTNSITSLVNARDGVANGLDRLYEAFQQLEGSNSVVAGRHREAGKRTRVGLRALETAIGKR